MKVSEDILGEKSKKDTASSEKLFLILGPQANPEKTDRTRFPEVYM